MTENIQLSRVIEVGGQQLTLTNDRNIIIVTTTDGKQFSVDGFKEGLEPEDTTDLIEMLWNECASISEGEKWAGRFNAWYKYADYAGWISREEARKEFDRSCRLAREWKAATGIPAEALMKDVFCAYEF